MATKLRAIAENTEVDEIKAALKQHKVDLYLAMGTQTVILIGVIVVTGVMSCGIPLGNLLKWIH
jgi:hypothetical protein